MNTRRRRSSPTSSSSAVSKSGTSASCRASSSRPSSSCLRSRSLLRRKRSMARCLAAAMSQAPGFSGMPDSCHCWSAATRASWARSSARLTSRTMRTRPPMSRGDSIRQTASIARCISVAVTATDNTTFRPPVQGNRRLPLALRGAVCLRRLVYLAKFALTPTDNVEESLGHFDGLCLRVCLEDGEAADYFLGLGERPVGHGHLSARDANARPEGAWQAALGGQQRAGLHLLFDQLAHLVHFLLCRRNASFYGLINAQKFHDHLSL